jgi:hypothetical protein
MDGAHLLKLLGRDLDGCTAIAKVANIRAVETLLDLHEHGILIKDVRGIHDLLRAENCKGGKVVFTLGRFRESVQDKLAWLADDLLDFEVRPKKHRLTNLLTGRSKKYEEALKELVEKCLIQTVIKELKFWEIDCSTHVYTNLGFPELTFRLQHNEDQWSFASVYLNCWNGEMAVLYQLKTIDKEPFVSDAQVHRALLKLKDMFIKEYFGA